MFGSQASAPAFGTPQSSTPAFSTPSLFGTPQSSTPAFGTGFGSSSSSPLFSSAFPSQPQQQQTPLFQPSTGFGFQTGFSSATPQTSPFPNQQLTTQMAPVSPLPLSLADRDIQTILDAYKEDPGNPKYAFKYLLFSVTDPQFRVKPAGVSDIMWAEAMGKLEGMESVDRERLWPQLVYGFRDLSQRFKLEDEVMQSDADRFKKTQTNVKMIQRHIQAEFLPRTQRLKQNEQSLQRRILRIMRILEGLESKGFRLPLTKGEAELAEKLVSFIRKLKGSGAESSRRVQNLLAVARVQANRIGAGNSVYLPGSAKIDEQSLADMQEVLQQQTMAIARLANVLNRDIRDMEIIVSDDTEMTDDVRS